MELSKDVKPGPSRRFGWCDLRWLRGPPALAVAFSGLIATAPGPAVAEPPVWAAEAPVEAASPGSGALPEAGTGAGSDASEAAVSQAPGAANPQPDVAAAPIVVEDPSNLDTPAFPGRYKGGAVRLVFDSRFVPDATVGSGKTDVYRPGLRTRLTLPLSERAVMRLFLRGHTRRYDFRGAEIFPGEPIEDRLDVYRTELALQGAYLLNEGSGFLLREGEAWSVLGGLSVASGFESGAFGDGLGAGGSLALGYEIERLVRLALGFTVRTSIFDGGVNVNPRFSLRWNLNESFTLRNRGLGLQLDYDLSKKFDVFVSAYRTSSSYRLRDRNGAPDDLSFRDREVLAGAGFEWKISRALRLNFEAGAVAWRELRLRSGDVGTIASEKGDPSAYFDLRIEVRL